MARNLLTGIQRSTRNVFNMKTLFKAVLAVFALSVATSVNAGVIVGDKEWRQVTDTVDFSWNDFSSVCSTSDGSCSGSLTNGTVGTVSFDGWTWANQTDVGQLFQALPGWSGPITHPLSHPELNSNWAPAFFDSLGFNPTDLALSVRSTWGTYRSAPGAPVNAAFILDSFVNTDVAFTLVNSADGSFIASPTVGGWFYRAVTTTPSVSAPPTLALLLVPALLMVTVRRKRLSH